MSEGEGPEWDSSLLTPRDLKTRPPTLRPLPTRSQHTHSRFVSNTPSAPLIPPGPDGHQLDWFRHQTITHSHSFSHTYCHAHTKLRPQPHTHIPAGTRTHRYSHICWRWLFLRVREKWFDVTESGRRVCRWMCDMNFKCELGVSFVDQQRGTCICWISNDRLERPDK